MAESEQNPHTEEIKEIFKKIGEKEMKILAKQAFKEASREFMDATYARFGRYSIAALGAAMFLACLYFIALTNGWHRP